MAVDNGAVLMGNYYVHPTSEVNHRHDIGLKIILMLYIAQLY